MLIAQVANMSLGGSKSEAMNSAVAAVIRMGMTVCVAAGGESVWSTYPPSLFLLYYFYYPYILILTSLKHLDGRQR